MLPGLSFKSFSFLLVISDCKLSERHSFSHRRVFYIRKLCHIYSKYIRRYIERGRYWIIEKNKDRNMSSLLLLENSVIPSHYDLQIELDPKKDSFESIVEIDLDVKESKFKQIKLHSKDLNIKSAKINNEFNLDVSYDESQQIVLLKADGVIELDATKQNKLAIVYSGKVKTVTGHQQKTTGVFKSNFMGENSNSADNYVIATHCQPSYARTIYPCIDEPSSKATYSLAVKTLKQFTIISCSKQSDVKETDSKYQTVKFEKTISLSPALFGFALGDFGCITSDVTLMGSRKIPVSVYSPISVEQSTYALDLISKYLPILESYFDKSFPGDKLDFVLLPFLSDMVMENFSMVTVQMDILLLSAQRLADQPTRVQTVQLVVHELVHQWMGNYVTFDSWEHLWFNEAFATWLAYQLISENETDDEFLRDYWMQDTYLHDQKGSSMINDSSIYSRSIAETYRQSITGPTSDKSTNELFDPNSYHKGIAILRNLQLTVGNEHLKSALSKVLNDKESFHKKSVKPIDIWKSVSETLKSENIINFMSSWTRLHGLPIISVSTEEESGKFKTTKLVQHRFLAEGKIDDVEDVPYHVPLFIQLPNGEMDTKHILMTDRSLKIDYPILLLNSNLQGFYYVSYESTSSYDEVCKQLTLGTFSDDNLYQFFSDLAMVIGNASYQLPIHISGLFKILNHISSSPKEIKLDDLKLWKSLAKGLELLQIIERAGISCKKSTKKVTNTALALFRKINWDENLSEEGNVFKLDVISQILFLARNTNEVRKVCQTYFKKIQQGPNNSLPIHIVNSIFTVYAEECENVKQWKKLFEFTMSTSGIVRHIAGADSKTLQTFALQSLGFVKHEELVTKVLNFVASNINVDGIENSLLGLVYNANVEVVENKYVRDIVWNWFKIHFDQWVKKYGADDKKVERVSSMVLQIFLDDKKKAIEADEKYKEIYAKLADSFVIKKTIAKNLKK